MIIFDSPCSLATFKNISCGGYSSDVDIKRRIDDFPALKHMLLKLSVNLIRIIGMNLER